MRELGSLSNMYRMLLRLWPSFINVILTDLRLWISHDVLHVLDDNELHSPLRSEDVGGGYCHESAVF
jgi:hypothetical protein